MYCCIIGKVGITETLTKTTANKNSELGLSGKDRKGKKGGKCDTVC